MSPPVGRGSSLRTTKRAQGAQLRSRRHEPESPVTGASLSIQPAQIDPDPHHHLRQSAKWLPGTLAASGGTAVSGMEVQVGAVVA
jgi:hypothetical protein